MLEQLILFLSTLLDYTTITPTRSSDAWEEDQSVALDGSDAYSLGPLKELLLNNAYIHILGVVVARGWQIIIFHLLNDTPFDADLPLPGIHLGTPDATRALPPACRSPSASPEPASHLPDNRVRVHVRKLNNCDAYARWFSSRGAVKLELPRECPERPTETDLYIHQWGDGDVQAWITKEGKWAVIVSGATHPSEAEPWSGRRFFVTADGKPAWLLDNSYKNKVRELERELTPLPGEGILAF